MSKSNTTVTPRIAIPAASECGPAMGALSEPERAFVIARIMEGLNQKEAARAAGYSGTDQSLRVTGSQLAHRPKVQAAILECNLELIRQQGAPSIRKLIQLRDKATDERVQLRAAQDLLDRFGGLTAAQVFQVNHDVSISHNLNMADLEAKRVQLERELGIKSLAAPIIEAEFTEVAAPEPEPLSDDPHNVNRRETNARRRDMTPEEIEADMAKVELERVEKLKVKYRNATEYRTFVASVPEDDDLADLF